VIVTDVDDDATATPAMSASAAGTSTASALTLLTEAPFLGRPKAPKIVSRS
jgi:hypothetical protein